MSSETDNGAETKIIDAVADVDADVDADVHPIKNTKMSICIPRISSWITEGYIRRIFNQVLIEKSHETETEPKTEPKTETDPEQINVCRKIIEKVDLIEKKNEKGESYKRAFVHFRNWDKLTSQNAILIWDKLHSGEIVKIMHKQPNYWKCSLSRVPRPNGTNTSTNTNKDNYSKKTKSNHQHKDKDKEKEKQ